jgi:hypothetical protein
MATYRQNISAQEIALKAQKEREIADERERRWKAAMNQEECYQAGYERGAEDREDNYTGAIERRSLGDDYSYPEHYRLGYKDAYFHES